MSSINQHGAKTSDENVLFDLEDQFFTHSSFPQRCSPVRHSLTVSSCTSAPTLAPTHPRSRRLGLPSYSHGAGGDGRHTVAGFLSRRPASQGEVCRGAHHRNPPQGSFPSQE